MSLPNPHQADRGNDGIPLSLTADYKIPSIQPLPQAESRSILNSRLGPNVFHFSVDGSGVSASAPSVPVHMTAPVRSYQVAKHVRPPATLPYPLAKASATGSNLRDGDGHSYPGMHEQCYFSNSRSCVFPHSSWLSPMGVLHHGLG